MNYRHAFHAGNFADVVKHLALVTILLHLRRKDAAFAVIDTHAGRGLYDLRSEATRRTGEAQKGIARILAALPDASFPTSFLRYVEIVRATGEGFYPGSPLIAAPLLRPQDRFVGIEKHPDDAAALAKELAPFANLRSECADGYARLKALLPPAERRGLILIDPPFESPDEFQHVARALGDALTRFANGIYLIWYPVKSPGEAHAFAGEVLAAGAKKVVRVSVALAPEEGGEKERLTSCGLIIVNPPYGFVEEMTAALAVATPLLSPAASSEVRWLSGEAD